MKPISELLNSPQKITSERQYLIQEIANSIGVPFINVLREVYHLTGDEGNKILRIILSDVLQTGDNVWFRGRQMRNMIEKSKGN